MSGNTLKEVREQARKNRLEMHRLIQQGLSEKEALERVFPGDRNRANKLKRWKKAGLWPLTNSESDFHSSDNSDIHCQASAPDTGDIQCNGMAETTELSEKDLLMRIRALLDTIEPAERPIGATAKGRKSPLKTTMIAIRIPESLDLQLRALGGLKSRHVEKAIMLYVKAMTAEEGQHDQ